MGYRRRSESHQARRVAYHHHMAKAMITLLILLLPALAPAAGDDGATRAGTVLSLVLPAGTAAVELWRGDVTGAQQLGATWLSTVVAAEALKRSTQQTRPDGTNDLSFPSGHAARAFSAAAYLRRRHGFDTAWPVYAGAVAVGWTRVQSQRHRWRDVAGSAALAEVMAWWWMEPAGAGPRAGFAPMRGGWTLVLETPL
jgi:membrane-associated phospholipid phosphatase